MKIGRNAPCPCGSGKKYKKCCLNKEKPPVDLLWRRLGNAYDRLVDDLMKYAHTSLDKFTLPLAMGEFLFWPDMETVEDEIIDHMSLFMPWLVFNWVYDPEDTDVELTMPAHQTIARMYAAHRGPRLDGLQRRLLEATCDQPFSFLEVVDCKPGQGYRLRDIFQGIETDVMEQRGSEPAKPGDILLGRIVQMDHVAMLIGCGSILIPPRFKPSIIELRRMMVRESVKITIDVLTDYDLEIRELYFDIYEALHTPPQLHNTDGDPLLFHTLHYKIDDPEAAFEKLSSLSVTETPQTLRQMATLDESGRVIRTEFPWSRSGHKANKALPNTLLGRILIDGHKLTVEVNSETRAEVIGKEIRKRMGGSAVYKTTEIRSPDAMMNDFDHATGDGPETGLSQDELMQIPEVREQMERLLVSHWEDWVDQEIPALSGKTPRRAVQTKDGRESVESLLLDAEQHLATDKAMGALGPGFIDGVRRKLGLDKVSVARKARDNRVAKEQRIGVIRSLIEDFGRVNLKPQYTAFTLKLCDRIAGIRELNIQRGREEIWAAAMVYVIARLNFLFDSESDTPITPDTICNHFDTVKSTVGNKATLIQQACNLSWGAEDFSRRDIVEAMTFVETPDGFVLPKSAFSDPDVTVKFVTGKEAEETERFTAELKRKKQMKTESDRTFRAKKKEEKQADDKQRNLFEDF